MSDNGLKDKLETNYSPKFGSLISEEDRLKEAEARKGLQSKVSRHWEKFDDSVKMEKMKALDIRGHLRRRLKHFIVEVPFEHDLGTFILKARLMSPGEVLLFSDDIAILQELNAKNKEVDKMLKLEVAGELSDEDMNRLIKEVEKLAPEGIKILDKMYKMLGEICVDKTLDFDFWKAGDGFNTDVPMRVLSEVQKVTQEYARDINKFRKE